MTETGKQVVFFDADCGFCQRSINRIRSRDQAGLLQFVPYQTPDLGLKYPIIDLAGMNRGIQTLLPDGRLLKNEAAMAAIFRRVPGLSWLSSLILFPLIRPFSALIYRGIAANRHRISSALGLNQCRISAPK